MSKPAVIEVAGREVTITHPDRVVFAAGGHTKLDLVNYYLAVAEGALRGVRGRPMVLKRFVKGIDEEAIWQKRAPTKRPDWIEVAELKYASGRSAEEVVVRDAAALAWVVNLGCVDLNPHPVLAEDLDRPDELRIDLDPVPGVEWRQIVEVATVAKEVLSDHGLTGWPKTSGSRGFHIFARIEPRWLYKDVRLAAETVAREVENRAPDLATSKWWKEERQGVFVDFNQNAKDRTVASAYSVRPVPDARVSTPLAWDEVADCRPDHFTLPVVLERFQAGGDPWQGMDTSHGTLDGLLDLAKRLGPAEKPPKGPAAASPRCRSSRSRGRRPRTRRWPGWSGGRPATRPLWRSWSRRTCSSTGCGGAARSGTGSGSTSSMYPRGSGPSRSRSRSTTTRGRGCASRAPTAAATEPGGGAAAGRRCPYDLRPWITDRRGRGRHSRDIRRPARAGLGHMDRRRMGRRRRGR
ncbi:DNA polymerase domain-containing protein [Phytohabitans flavus]|uniref:DNA polymerase domain-containing protein n=1 Tax=Phytohabitans flavus TaxID=1076124 RepID=UPI0036432E2F